jgi:hypothetical protein
MSASSIGIEDYPQQAYPVAFWDLFGKKGTPVAPR